MKVRAMQGAVIAAVLLALVSVVEARRWTGTLETSEGTMPVRVTGLLVGAGQRVEGRWHCRGAACPVRRAKVRFKCVGNIGVPPITEGVLWTGRRNAPRKLWRLSGPDLCVDALPNINVTLFLASGRTGTLSIHHPASPSGAFLEPVGYE